ncbi:hypothetical protein PEC18_05015 [Paucibacter sp. O1-1]|nr:hypothetical protein [Paucibacter sp. O1-1]MDA3825230.1 hypothetical protein [Paucibacter sp. O1-1]
MSAVQRLAVEASAAQHSVGVVLLRLLVRIVAGLAQGLQIAVAEEELEVTTMRPHVVNDPTGHRAPKLQVEAAQRVQLQLLLAQFLPAGCLVEVVVVGAGHTNESPRTLRWRASWAWTGSRGSQNRAGKTSVPEL